MSTEAREGGAVMAADPMADALDPNETHRSPLPKTAHRPQPPAAEPIAQAADWSQPQEVSDLLVAFPGSVLHLMPPYRDIPDEFKRWGTGTWVQWQEKWFYEGLSQAPTPRDGIDGRRAMRHLHCVQRSYEPPHEHKTAAVAYLASLWFKDTGDAVPATTNARTA